jgi:hypothetical protein
MRTAREEWPDYQSYLASEVWQARRAWKLEEADYRCQVCYSGLDLEVHHRTYARLGHERQNDLTVLCSLCHQRHHGIKALPDTIPAGSSAQPDPAFMAATEDDQIAIIQERLRKGRKALPPRPEPETPKGTGLLTRFLDKP